MATKQALNAIKKFRTRELSILTDLSQPPKLHNPFLPFKNPETGRWRPPKFSLRRQAELVKKAKASNTLSLLPPGPKLPPSVLAASQGITKLEPEEWNRDVVWTGEVKEKTVRGLDVGYLNRVYLGRKKFFKGHKWERVKEKRVKRRKILMRDMKKRILSYKTVSPSLVVYLFYFIFAHVHFSSVPSQEATETSQTCAVWEDREATFLIEFDGDDTTTKLQLAYYSAPLFLFPQSQVLLMLERNRPCGQKHFFSRPSSPLCPTWNDGETASEVRVTNTTQARNACLLELCPALRYQSLQNVLP
jgi:large subunit ribosomal protein L25